MDPRLAAGLRPNESRLIPLRGTRRPRVVNVIVLRNARARDFDNRYVAQWSRPGKRDTKTLRGTVAGTGL